MGLLQVIKKTILKGNHEEVEGAVAQDVAGEVLGVAVSTMSVAIA